MKTIRFTATYKRDVKRLGRQGKDFGLLREVVDAIAQEHPPAPQLRDHALKGTWKGHRKLHLESDWLLIYRVAGDTLFLVRTGSHAELFGL